MPLLPFRTIRISGPLRNLEDILLRRDSGLASRGRNDGRKQERCA